MNASHVVVDTRDGYMFWRDRNGKHFDSAGARQFADQRNAEYTDPVYKREQPVYQVFALIGQANP